MKEELIHFGDNDLVLGVRPIYEFVVLRYGGNTWQKWDYKASLREIILKALYECENIRFIMKAVNVHPLLFDILLPCEYENFTNFEMQTILLNQELFEKTKWYNVDGCGHNSVYEVENLREVRIQDVLKDI